MLIFCSCNQYLLLFCWKYEMSSWVWWNCVLLYKCLFVRNVSLCFRCASEGRGALVNLMMWYSRWKVTNTTPSSCHSQSSRSFSRRSEESEVLTAQLVFIRGMVIMYNEALNAVIMYVGDRTIIEMFECMNIKRKHASKNYLEEERLLSVAKKRDERERWRCVKVCVLCEILKMFKRQIHLYSAFKTQR